MNKTEIKTAQGKTGWTIEAKIAISDLWGWGNDSFLTGWSFQVVRMERPSGQQSSWNPMSRFPEGPERFGILFLRDKPTPVYVEYGSVKHLSGERFVVESVIRKLVPGTLPLTLNSKRLKGEFLPLTLENSVTTVYLPCTMQAKEVTSYNKWGFSNQVDFSVNTAIQSKAFKRCLYVGHTFKKTDLAKVTAPAAGESSKKQPITGSFFQPVKKSVVAGDNLAVTFDLPITVQTDSSQLRLTLTDNNGKAMASDAITLQSSKGELILATAALKGGTYNLSATLGDLEFTFSFQIVADELF
jgi:hypothetical protein